ncbi:MAG: hypothetical protein WKF34_09485 [Pyrinomonadaceae bacterium]
MLEKERRFFEKKKTELVDEHLGQFVLIRESKLIGIFNTIEEALAEGARQFGLSPFLVRQITNSAKAEINIPALALGILNANSTRPI